MKTPWVFIIGMWGLGAIAAGSTQDPDRSFEGLVKDMIDTVEQITKTVLTIQDKDSATSAKPELKKAATKMLELRKLAEKVKQPNKVEKERLEKEYAPKMELAVKKLGEATAKVHSVPGAAEALAELAILADKKDKHKGKVGKGKH
jgi:type II secretory pathway component HofQ